MKKLKICSFLLAFTLVLSLLPLYANASNKNSEKISEQLLEMMSKSPDNRIPVCLWTEDIDFNKVEQQVKEKTGLVINNIRQENKKLDIDVKSKADKDTLVKQMKDYLDKTKELREKERVLMDKYVSEKRKVATSEYNKQNTENLSILKIPKDDIIFQSQYSPMIIAKLTPQEILKVAQNVTVVSISMYKDVEALDNSRISSVQTVRADITCSYGLTGSGVKIGQIEPGVPDTNYSGFDGKVSVISGSTEMHATDVAMVMHTVAPDANIISIAASTPVQFYSGIENLISRGVSVINMSANWGRGSGGDYWYSDIEKWFDHISTVHEVTFVAVAGNGGIGSEIGSPGLAFNVITVGAINDNETGNILTDDCLASYTSTANGGEEGCAKPDVLAPGTSYGTGTSFAAPIVAGLVAQMMQYDNTLKSRARAVKAIISACCDRKVGNSQGGSVETMQQGLTAEQGAGVVNALNMYSILTRGNYVSGNFTSNVYTRTITLSSPFNVSATWIRANNISSNHTDGSVNVDQYVDLDLSVNKTDGSLVSKSILNKSSTEMIYGTNLTSGNYIINLKKWNTSADKVVWYGIAWY